MAYRVSFVATFGDSDPAGIIYFVRFFDYFHRTLEAYFEEVLGQPYAEMVMKRRLGVPVVRVEGDFFVPVAFGQKFTVEVSPKALGRTSLTFAYTIFKEGEPKPCASFAITHVATSMDSFTPMPLPDDLRARLERDLPSTR